MIYLVVISFVGVISVVSAFQPFQATPKCNTKLHSTFDAYKIDIAENAPRDVNSLSERYRTLGLQACEGPSGLARVDAKFPVGPAGASAGHVEAIGRRRHAHPAGLARMDGDGSSAEEDSDWPQVVIYRSIVSYLLLNCFISSHMWRRRTPTVHRSSSVPAPRHGHLQGAAG